MGRFYKSSKGNYLDFIYKQPTNLLLKAQQAADQSLAQQEQAYGDLYGRLQINALTPDDQRAKNILEGYEQRIEEKAADLRNDPLKYINNPGEFRKLSNEIYKDKTRGQWASIEANAAAKAAFSKKLDKQVEADKMTRDEADQLLANADARFAKLKGTFGEAGDVAINTWRGDMISDFVDVNKRMDELLTGIEYNERLQPLFEKSGLYMARLDDGGRYVIKDTTTNQVVSGQRVANLVDTLLGQDDVINNYWNTRTRAGIIGYSPEEIANKRALLKAQALNKFAYDRIQPGLTADESAFDLASAKGETAGMGVTLDGNTTTQYWNGSHSSDDRIPSGSYTAVGINTGKTISLANSINDDVIEAIDRELAIGKSDPTGKGITQEAGDELKSAWQRGLASGNFDAFNEKLANSNIQLDQTTLDRMNQWTPEVVFQNNLNKSRLIKNVDQFRRDNQKYNQLIKDTKDWNILKPEEKRLLAKNAGLEKFYTVLQGGNVSGVTDASGQRIFSAVNNDADVVLALEDIMSAIETGRTNKEYDPDYSYLSPRISGTKFLYNYEEALSTAAKLLDETGYRDRKDNIVIEQTPSKSTPDWSVVTYQDINGNIKEDAGATASIADAIIQKTHDKSGKKYVVNLDKFKNFWGEGAGESFTMTFDQEGLQKARQQGFKLDPGVINKQFTKEGLKKLETSELSVDGADVVKQPIAIMNIEGQPVEMKIGDLQTRIQKVNGRYTTVYVQNVTYATDKGSVTSQLIKEIPYGALKVDGKDFTKERKEKEAEYGANNTIDNTNKIVQQQSANTSSFGIDVENSYIPVDVTKIKDDEEGFAYEVKQEVPSKLIALNNKKTRKVDYYVVPQDFDDHLTKSFNDLNPNVLRAIKQHHSNIMQQDEPFTAKQAAGILEFKLLNQK